ncbi:sugar transferase [Sulfitobacter sabulilitoris]|uniref:Sugar transferase n=1 Tax=Sulfitobacter sabulilitoris TaxID=2562655 RepID=A0A5S3PD43_9RHOB|nr:sugar transferase [Sulfitobacter sabulilitoris]TMM49299.1 sugar transferase [Sulfitobacter sabulilitoris]
MTKHAFDGFGPSGKSIVPIQAVSALSAPAEIIRHAGTRHRKGWYRFTGKQALDVMLVILSLPVSLPLIALCAVALWIEGGNPFYVQNRLGQSGRVFSILKLRTMTRDADAVLAEYLANDPELQREWAQTQKLKNDPRITPVGRLLRSTSIDELPQLFNVLKGDMSLVGPRPMMPDQLSIYGDPRAYFALKPGLTGIWQVSARNEQHFSYRREADAVYHQTVSFFRDLVILFKTVGVVLRRTGY